MATGSARENGIVTIPTTDVVQDLSKIDEHLADLYRRAAGVAESEAFVPVVRTLLMNIVAYTSSGGEMATVASDIAEVMGTHPCRAIIINLGEGTETQAAATISTVCGITDRGDRRLCGEVIELHAAALGQEIAGMVMPLLAPDVPVFVWLPNHGTCAGPEYTGIADAADHVILDSRRFVDLRAGLESMSPLCVNGNPDRTVQDLSWISLHPWRDLIAQHFDPPVARQYLAKLTEIEAKYSPGEREDAPPSVPLLLVSWLMGRTGLDVSEVTRGPEGGYDINAVQDGKPVTVRLVPEDLGYSPGSLNSVTIRGGDAEGTASFVTHRLCETRISATEECAGICFAPMVMEFPVQSVPSLIAGALDSYERDQVHENAVAFAVRILGDPRE